MILKMKKFMALALAMALSAIGSNAFADSYPKQELRAVWFS